MIHIITDVPCIEACTLINSAFSSIVYSKKTFSKIIIVDSIINPSAFQALQTKAIEEYKLNPLGGEIIISRGYFLGAVNAGSLRFSLMKPKPAERLHLAWPLSLLFRGRGEENTSAAG